MYCNQCEQTLKSVACTKQGICGKKEIVAHTQDQLIYALRTLARIMLEAREQGVQRQDVDDFLLAGLFSTLTNVNFDETVLEEHIKTAVRLREELHLEAQHLPVDIEDWAVKNAIAKGVEHIKAHECGIEHFHHNENVRSALQTILFSLKGVAAYGHHAAVLGERDPDMVRDICNLLVAGIIDGKEYSLEEWLGLVLTTGTINIRAMQLLDSANTTTYGDPVPTTVSLGAKKGKCILVSGHDLKDLYDLLVQTEGTGIHVYTHGEMLPAHAYPKLHAFSHFAGHFGTAWQNQHKELPDFPGPVLFTTNCIQDPKNYADKVFTTGLVGWPNVTHCPHGDFSQLIAKAKEMQGFEEDVEGQNVWVGFGRKTLLDLAPEILEAVKEGAVKHIFLVGGCDGAKPGRNYYTEFVEKTPQDSLVLTLACGKFRFFDKKLGFIGKFPRLLDVGQCNDAYSAVCIALELAKACDCSVNDLPLSLVLSWYEQKAVAILLSLLALGVKNIYLGPSLPAFITPDILAVLVEKYHIMPNSTPEEDIAACLAK